MATALPAIQKVVSRLGAIGKPVHFHLHDGHPLSKISPFGVSDHLAFDSKLPLPFGYKGRSSARLLYGVDGLRQIVKHAVQAVGRDRVTFTLEIHPTFEELPLADDGGLFNHWSDKTNARKMNHWVSILVRNHQLLRAAVVS
jgi:hypothetical protein